MLDRSYVVQRSVKILRHDFVSHAGLVFASQLALNICNYVFHFVISRKLGTDGYGTLQSLLAIVTLLSVPSGILSLVTAKYVSELQAAAEDGKIRWLLLRLIGWLAVGAVAAFVLVASLHTAFARYFSISDSHAFVIVALFLAIYCILPILRAVLQGLQRFRAFAVSLVVEGAGKAALGVALVSAGFGATGALGGATLAASVALLYTLYAVYGRHANLSVPFRIDLVRVFQSFGGAAVAILATAVLTSMDMLVVKHFFAPGEAGIYAAVALVGRVLLFVVGFVPTVALPKVTALASQGKSPRKVLAISLGLLAAISIVGLGVLAAAPAGIIRLMAGSSFVAGAPILIYYGITMVLLAAIGVATTYKIGIHRFDFAAPLLVIIAVEFLAMQFYHSTLMDIVLIMMCGHLLALLACLYRITVPVAIAASSPARANVEVA
jgi:O-antigen/teichoic acid export membrane protein